MEDIGVFRRQAQAIFNDPETHLKLWLHAAEKRSWTLRLDSLTASIPLAELAPNCAKFLVTFSQAILSAPKLAWGAVEFRESLQTITFMVGWMAGQRSTLTDVLALVHGLHDIMPGPHRFFQALEIAVGEAFFAAVTQKEQEHFKEVMAKSQIVFALHSQLPCAFLVGEPDRWAVDEALGRLLMLAMMQGTSVMLMDVSCVIAPETMISRLLTLLSEENREVKAHVILSGLPPRLTQELSADLPEGISLQDDITQAIEEAGKQLGLKWTESNA